MLATLSARARFSEPALAVPSTVEMGVLGLAEVVPAPDGSGAGGGYSGGPGSMGHRRTCSCPPGASVRPHPGPSPG